MERLLDFFHALIAYALRVEVKSWVAWLPWGEQCVTCLPAYLGSLCLLLLATERSWGYCVFYLFKNKGKGDYSSSFKQIPQGTYLQNKLPKIAILVEQIISEP